jgi:cytochrome P450
MRVVVEVASLADEVGALFRSERLEDPFAVWNRLREEATVFQASGMTILTSYAHVKAMLPDRALYSARMWDAGGRPERLFATFSPEMERMWNQIAAYESMSLAVQDGADHDRLRSIAHRFFTPRRVQRIDGEIRGFWDELLEGAAQTEVYDHKRVSQGLALRVITSIVGCPSVDGDFVTDLLDRLSKGKYGTSDEAVLRDAYCARMEFNDYIERVIIAGYRQDPESNDFVRALMHAEGEDNLSALELSAMVSVMLFGGIETTAILVSTGLLELLRHREQWEWLCEDPVRRVPGAVEELMRYVAPAQFVPRIAATDFQIDGVPVSAGETVVAAIGGAHRDPSEYENPDELDITNPRAHLGFGLGPKFCLGASVARAEARIALTTLAQRYPDVELAIDAADLDWSGGPASIRSLRELPIALGEKRAASDYA